MPDTPTPTREEVRALASDFAPYAYKSSLHARVVEALFALATPDPWAEADAAMFEDEAKEYDLYDFGKPAALRRRASQRARGVPVTEDGR